MSHSNTVRLPMVEESTESAQGNTFDLVRRGYDRRQVDDHLAALATQVAELKVAHQRESRRAERAEGELQNARVQIEQQAASAVESSESGTAQGFGYRVEKLLRTAENEASEVRSSAAREATALLERAREEAEKHRHEVEQSLITRTSALDQEAAQRKVELDERERQIAEQTSAARDEVDRMFAEVHRQSEQQRLEAQARVEQERASAEKSIRERHLAAEQELGRLRGLHEEVRGQLARLLDSLATEFGGTQPHIPQPQQRSRPAQQSHPRPRPQPHPRQQRPAPPAPVQPRQVEEESTPVADSGTTPVDTVETEAVRTEA